MSDRRAGAAEPVGERTETVEGTHAVRVRDERNGETVELAVEDGTVLRDALLARDRSPHSTAGQGVNCGGRGLCATCGVRVARADDEAGSARARSDDAGGADPAPEHWHDRLAARFGYPRLSCQLRVREDLVVTIPAKRVWGRRE